jgi:hypothetical protein
MKKWAIMLGLTTSLYMPLTAGADIYRWKDAHGVVHFSNQSPPEGVTIIETIEETPFDAESDRRRIDEERRLRLERRKLELEERKADSAAREREARLKLEEANRRLEEAQKLEQEARERAKGEDCDDGLYLRYGVCMGYPLPSGGRRRHPGPSDRSPDLYRHYYRNNNNLYYKEPHKPDKPTQTFPPDKPGMTPQGKTETPKSAAKPGKIPKPSAELLPKESHQAPVTPAAPK